MGVWVRGSRVYGAALAEGKFWTIYYDLYACAEALDVRAELGDKAVWEGRFDQVPKLLRAHAACTHTRTQPARTHTCACSRAVLLHGGATTVHGSARGAIRRAACGSKYTHARMHLYLSKKYMHAHTRECTDALHTCTLAYA